MQQPEEEENAIRSAQRRSKCSNAKMGEKNAKEKEMVLMENKAKVTIIVVGIKDGINKEKGVKCGECNGCVE
jgi:hypothetical protein